MNDRSSTPDSLMMTVHDVAEALKFSPRHVWTLDKKGEIPRPIRFGRSVRWYREDFVTWFKFGIRNRDEWDVRKAELQEGHHDLH